MRTACCACDRPKIQLRCRLREVSSVKVRHLDPEWGEIFDLPVASDERHLEEALEGLERP